MKRKTGYSLATKAAFLTCVAVVLTSCPQGFVPLKPEIPGTVEEASDLFVEDTVSGNVNFSTNDSRYWTPSGYTLWCANEGEEDTPFVSRTVRISKPSGDRAAGYGIVFCHALREDFGQTMLVCLINRQGQYLLGEACDAVFTPFRDDEGIAWHSSSYLNGNGSENVISLSYDSDTMNFTLTFNEHVECAFNDTVPPVHTAGRNGYLVVISPQDDFPEESVTVVFHEEE